MSGYDWLFSTMQLVYESHVDDASETDPILSQSKAMSCSSDPLSLHEITPVGVDDDHQSIDADECCSLVNVEQPQCRICFDSEGYFLSQLVYYFPPKIFSYACFT